jgi:hypothetical protein
MTHKISDMGKIDGYLWENNLFLIDDKRYIFAIQYSVRRKDLTYSGNGDAYHETLLYESDRNGNIINMLPLKKIDKIVKFDSLLISYLSQEGMLNDV